MNNIRLPKNESAVFSRSHDGFKLLLISFIILFLELAAIRWFPAHVLYLTFFTNVVLLASFLGMSVGCLSASRRRNYLNWTPLLLVIALAAAHAVEISSGSFIRFVDVGNQASPQQVYFGTEYHSQDLSRYAIPVEILCGFFFGVIALAFVGPGQELGRALKRWPSRVQAYSLNIAGSIAGIALFAACSWLEIPRVLLVFDSGSGSGVFLFRFKRRSLSQTFAGRGALTTIMLVLVVWLSAYNPVHDKDSVNRRQSNSGHLTTESISRKQTYRFQLTRSITSRWSHEPRNFQLMLCLTC